MSIASDLKSAIDKLAALPQVKVVERVVKPPAGRAALERARRDGATPKLLVGLWAEMNGLTFEWGFAPRRKGGKVKVVGRIEVPTLEESLSGFGLDEGVGADTEEVAAVIRLLDRAPQVTDRLWPCFAEGDFGVWNSYDDTFMADAPIGEDSYYRLAGEHLFMPGWFEARCENEETPEEIVEARERLGLPPLEE